MPRLRAFSLIELLVVVAIVLVLMGLLIPVVGTVRAQARQTDCGGRLRQIGIAVAAYRGDFQSLPKVTGTQALTFPHVVAGSSEPTLPNTLKEYVDGALSTFYCPASAQFRTQRTHWPNAAVAQYSMTYQVTSWPHPAATRCPGRTSTRSPPEPC